VAQARFDLRPIEKPLANGVPKLGMSIPLPLKPKQFAKFVLRDHILVFHRNILTATPRASFPWRGIPEFVIVVVLGHCDFP
jgi:hypothetical protein